MAMFYDLPISNNLDIDVYAVLRSQFMCAVKKRHQLEALLSRITNPGQIKFYKRKVKYTPKNESKPRVYEYNCPFLRFEKKENGKIKHYTRFLTKKEYEQVKKESVLYHFFYNSLTHIKNLIKSTKDMILSAFYHHPDDVPDLSEEEINVEKEVERSFDERVWHDTYKVAVSPDKYKCVDRTGTAFMSRGELLLNEAFLHFGFSPQYETILEINDLLGYTESISNGSSKYFFPDFKCCCAGKTYYFEYFGMMNDPLYFQEACRKIETYIRAGIIPGHNFIAFCSGDSSAINMTPVTRVLSQIAAGRNLLNKKNAKKLPGIIKLDNKSWQLPKHLTELIISESSKHFTQPHKFKSASFHGK